MADSTVFTKSADIGKLKVVELKKELKSRGLSTSGDKNELVARLQSVLRKDSLTEDTLDSDELDSDGVLDDEDEDDEKAVHDLIGEELNDSEIGISAVDKVATVASESLNSVAVAVGTAPRIQSRTLKRRAPPSTEALEDKLLSDLAVNTAPDLTPVKKIIPNRAAITAPVTLDTNKQTNGENLTASRDSRSTKPLLDAKARLEMRAKRFGIPMTESSAKEARKARFGNVTALPSDASLDVLKKRAERFGTSVSKIMVDVENKEKLEKRKAKFGMIKT